MIDYARKAGREREWVDQWLGARGGGGDEGGRKDTLEANGREDG